MVAVTVNIPVISAGSLWDQTPDQSSFFFFFLSQGLNRFRFSKQWARVFLSRKGKTSFQSVIFMAK